MKTLQLGMGWFPEQSGGLNRYYYGASHHLPEVGVNLLGLVTGSEQVALTTQQSIQAFAATESNLLSRWQGVRQSVKQLKLAEYDLAVAHFAIYAFPVLNQLNDLPLVFHFHGPWALESDAENQKPLEVWLKKSLEKVVYHRVNSFIVLSQAFKELLHQQYGVRLSKIHVVPGGVDLEQFEISSSQSQARAKLGWEQDRTILFCVRRLAKRMGLENLVQAIAIVKTQYPDILLCIAGKGALAPALETQIAELNLTEQVRLLGYLPDEQLPIAYRAANFSVVPTVSFEGFGLIIIESLATGTPVLGTPVGGIPEILQPFCPDLLFEDASVNKLAQGIIEVLAHKRQLPSSEACQTYVKNNYAWSVIAPQIKSVYQQTINDV
ncbi:MAG: glycosyltransferase family 4 protein [Cyanobacteria bacterium P01_G01_bin.39]